MEQVERAHKNRRMGLLTQNKALYKRQKGRTPVVVRSSRWLERGDKGVVGIIAAEPGQIRVSQLIALDKVIAKNTKKLAAVTKERGAGKARKTHQLRVYPHIPLTKKPNETGLGRGKGPIHDRVARVGKNQILVEIQIDDMAAAERIAREAGSKLSIKTSLIRP